MSEADTLSVAVIATIRQDAAEWGTDCGMGLHPLDANAARSKGCGVSMADASSAVLAAGDGTAGAPQDPRPGAHPFWPGDRAIHGTGLTAVAQEKNPLNVWRNNASEKKSAVEIDSGALWGTVERGKGLAATHVAEGVEYPRFWGLGGALELILEEGGYAMPLDVTDDEIPGDINPDPDAEGFWCPRFLMPCDAVPEGGCHRGYAQCPEG